MSEQPERKIDDRLGAWVDGRLSDRERERFVAEMRVNPQLRVDLAEYERTVAAVRAALRAPTRPADLTARVLGAVAAQATKVAAGSGTLRRQPLYWSLAAAAALLVLAIGIDAWPGGATTPDSATLDRVASVDSLAPSSMAPSGDESAFFAAAEQPGGAKPAAKEESTLGFVALDNSPADVPTGAPAVAAPGGAETRGAVSERNVEAEGQQQVAADPSANTNQPTQVSAEPAAPSEQRVPSELKEAAEKGADENRRKAGAGADQLTKEQAAGREPANPRAARAEGDAVAKSDAPDSSSRARGMGAGGSGAGGRRARPAQPVPMVSLTRYRSAEPSAPGVPAGVPATRVAADDFFLGTWRGQAVPTDLEAFLASQAVQPPTYAKKLGAGVAENGVRYGNLSLVPLSGAASDALREQDKSREQDGDAAQRPVATPTEEKRKDSAPAPAADGEASPDNYWLVEGSKAEVAQLLQKLAEYAKRSGLELANGELAEDSPVLQRPAAVAPAGAPTPTPSPATPAAPSGPPTSGPASGAPAGPSVPSGKPPAAANEEQALIVLRFRVLPRK